MKKLLLALGAAICLAFMHPAPAAATTCTIAHVFVTGETLTNTILNANPNAFVTCGNNIDNTNIGTAGIYASQIIPTTSAQATFGGAIGYKIYPNAAAQVPLTISGTSGQTADLLDVTLTSGGTPIFKIGPAGAITSGGVFATTVNSNSAAALYAALGAAIGIGSNASGGSGEFDIYAGNADGRTAGFYYNNGSTAALSATISNNGAYASSGGTGSFSSNGSTQAYVPPVYTVSGAATASTMHIVSGTVSVSSSSPATITLSGAAAFSSSTSYQVVTSVGSSGSSYVFAVVINSGTSFSINTTSGSASESCYWIAIGY